VHVMSALKGAGPLNSYKLCTALDYEYPYMPQWDSIYKARPKLQGGHVSVSGLSRIALDEHRRPADTERG
jgi:hypothetical protein